MITTQYNYKFLIWIKVIKIIFRYIFVVATLDTASEVHNGTLKYYSFFARVKFLAK